MSCDLDSAQFQFSHSVVSDSFVTPWTAAHQASLSITNTRSLPKLMSIESMMLSNHLILGHPLLLLPSIFPSIRVFSNESAICIRWSKYWSFSFNISPSNEHSVIRTDLLMWSTGEGNGKPLQNSCLENPMNSMKRQKDRTLKDELPRSVGAQ